MILRGAAKGVLTLAVSNETDLPEGMWGSSNTCRGLILYLNSEKNNTNRALE